MISVISFIFHNTDAQVSPCLIPFLNQQKTLQTQVLPPRTLQKKKQKKSRKVKKVCKPKIKNSAASHLLTLQHLLTYKNYNLHLFSCIFKCSNAIFIHTASCPEK